MGSMVAMSAAVGGSARAAGGTRRTVLGRATAAGVAMTAGAALAACGGEASPSQGAAPAARRDVTLEWMAGANPTEEQIYRGIASAFEAANGPTKVAFVNGNGAEGGWQVKLETLAAAGTPPDVMWHGPEWFPGVVSKGIYRPIDDYLARQPKADVADFIPRVMEQFAWEGKQYGIPAGSTTMVLFYNKDLFDREGVAYPDAGWTFEGKFLEAARKLTKREGDRVAQYGVGNPHRNWVWPWAGGAEYLDKENKKVILNTFSEAARWFQFSADLRLRHRVAPSVEEQRVLQGGTRQHFLTGQIAMDLEGIWTLVDRKDIKNFSWDVAPVPMGSKARPTPFFSDADMVCRESKNPDEAFALCVHIGSPASEKVIAAQTGRVPARKSLTTFYTSLDSALPPKNRQVIVDALVGYARTAPAFRDFREFDSRILGTQMTLLNEGKINAQQMIAEMMPKMEAVLK